MLHSMGMLHRVYRELITVFLLTSLIGFTVCRTLVSLIYKDLRRISVFSERVLMFTFAICCRPSVCRLSVCNARAPYSGG